jgi:hypothetical protein
VAVCRARCGGEGGFFGGAGQSSTVGVVPLSRAVMLPASILRHAVRILWPRDVAPRAVPSASSAARNRLSISVSDRGLWSSIVAQIRPARNLQDARRGRSRNRPHHRLKCRRGVGRSIARPKRFRSSLPMPRPILTKSTSPRLAPVSQRGGAMPRCDRTCANP